MNSHLDLNSIESYRTFLRAKSMPSYRFSGRLVQVPDEYWPGSIITAGSDYTPWPGLFDYQRDISRIAIRKRKYCVFAEPGLGKTFIIGECVRHATPIHGGRSLIVSPLMVIDQTIGEFARFYGDALKVDQIRANQLQQWMNGSGEAIGITNFEAITPELTQGNVRLIAVDESSMMKSHYGKWGTKLIDLGRGLEWKYCFTGTPAPNDRIEYANHAVFMDAFPNVNAFLARFFVNRGQTDNRWELRPHALKPFYRALSHWCIFLVNPGTYGWKDNAAPLPPINVHIHRVELTREQLELTTEKSGALFAANLGGIATRASYGQIAKGAYKGKRVDSLKPQFIKDLCDAEPNASTLIWCIYNPEQEILSGLLTDAINIDGSTPHATRMEGIERYKSGHAKRLISKSKILGFGLNLQITRRMIFSGLQDSYEGYFQCIKRANRIGSTEPLDVHIPITEIEEPMIDTVLRKAKRVQQDTEEQEVIFKECGWNYA